MAPPRPLPGPVVDRLARLAPDQRAAAVAPPGPVLCVAPAGSGKTTTLVARVAWLVGTGVDPSTIAAITFNRRAAEELRSRLDPALEPLDVAPGAVRVRTFHALGLEILRSAGRAVRLVARASLLPVAAAAAGRQPDAATGRLLDDAFSRLKLDLRVTTADVAADPAPGPIARAFLAYQGALADAGALDFDDLVGEALRALEVDERLLASWRGRCSHLLVDEVQDVDASQLAMALRLAQPANRIFLVGDDDQSIYGWRLADVRRVLGLAGRLPGLARIDLTVNYRCPGPVVDRAGRLVEHNRERFAKTIRARSPAPGRIVLAPTPTAGDANAEAAAAARILGALPADDGSRAILARTRRELLPAAAHALEAGIPFRADGLTLPLEDPRLDALLDLAASATPAGAPLLVRLGRLAAGARLETLPLPGGRADHDSASVEDGPDTSETVDSDAPELGSQAALLAAVLGWAVARPTLDALRADVETARSRLAELRRPDAGLVLATAHSTKGLEFDHVAVIGCSEGRFPSPRALGEAGDPARALEEERRLAYVAWTRARRTLVLAFEPAAPSRFLLEAFDPDELPAGRASARGPPRRCAVHRLVPRWSHQVVAERADTSGGTPRGPDAREPRRQGGRDAMQVTSSTLAFSAAHSYAETERSSERLEAWRGDWHVLAERQSEAATVSIGASAARSGSLADLPGALPTMPKMPAMPSLSVLAGTRPTAGPRPASAILPSSDTVGAGGQTSDDETALARLVGARLWQLFLLLAGDDESARRIARATAELARAQDLGPDPALEAAVARGSVAAAGQPPATAPAPDWGIRVDRTVEVTETEATSMTATGTVRTADGRTIDIAYALTMARAESVRTEEHLRAGAAARDPLALALDGGPVRLDPTRTDSIDVDADGAAEQVASLVSGSAYLVRDLNGNGAIDAAGELFGPTSGSGFGELAALDTDHSGWIDSGDAGFGSLRVWSPADGSLRTLTEAGVGALGLARAATPFELTDGATGALGRVVETGVFLREDGTPGALSRIDLVA